MSPPPPDDPRLLSALAAGEESAFAQAYDAYGGQLFRAAYGILTNAAEAEEVVQETFMLLWRKARAFDASRGRLVGFLMTNTRNRSIDRLRRRRLAPRAVEPAGLTTVEADAATPLDVAAVGDAATAVREALSSLPEPERHVLTLAYFEGLTQTEIAQRTESPLGTVKTRARNGLRRLRGLLPAGLGGEA